MVARLLLGAGLTEGYVHWGEAPAGVEARGLQEELELDVVVVVVDTTVVEQSLADIPGGTGWGGV